MSRISRICIFTAIMLAAIMTAASGLGEDVFSVKRIGNLIPFNDNAFAVNVPESGEINIRIHDDISVYRIITQRIDAGETTIHWDGCAFNHEKLASKSYIVTAEFTADSGEKSSLSFNTPVEYTGQCLQYMLPSGSKVSLSEPDEWFVEFRTVQKGTVVFEFQEPETGNNLYSYSAGTTGGRINRLTYTEMTDKTPLPAGNFHVCAYEKSKPDEQYEFDLTVQNDPFEKKNVFLTGDILPSEGMSEDEIWQIMQRPSVVVDIDPFKHQKVFAEQSKDSQSIGTLHGQTQALKVERIDGEWVLIGAWNHEEAEYVEGWVPLSVLKVSEPNPEYGILINKKEQTMDVYHCGKRIDTLQVSTGRPEKRHTEQETAAGSFLTGYHRVDFSMNGKKYDYVIQYDGGNLLHQIPYEWGRDKKDFSLGRGYLGAKASHACVRIQAEPGEHGINAYWIWTHIPYHTRVIILDDPVERRPVTAKPTIIEKTIKGNRNQIVIGLEDGKAAETVSPATEIREISGHMIGYACCNEKEYLKNPGIIEERIHELRQKGAEKIILKCFWDRQNEENHSAVQEAMARKGARAGASLVIGNGNKMFLGCEIRGNCIILYGLGREEKKTGKKEKLPSFTAEAIFDLSETDSLAVVVLKPSHAFSDTDKLIEKLAGDSVGDGIGKIYLMTGDQK